MENVMDTIVLCGGGTLGHFTPNLAIYQEMKNEFKFVYMGTKNGLEKDIAKLYMPYREIETCKLIRRFTLKNLLIPFKLLKGFFQARKILKEIKPKLIFSKGGFASVPVVFAGRSLKIPCISHESDFSLGLANKLIKKKCKFVCTSFEETATKLSNGIYTGTPLRKQIFLGNKKAIKNTLNIKNDKKSILVLGGSLGSGAINNAILQALPKLSSFNIIHITGKGKIDGRAKYGNYYQVEFTSNIEDYFALADLVITRGGSNTLFELLALNKNMLIIPLSTKASRGDQIENAKEFAKNEFASVLYEEDLTTETLIASIQKCFKNHILLKNNRLKYVNGTDNVCNLIRKTIDLQL